MESALMLFLEIQFYFVNIRTKNILSSKLVKIKIRIFKGRPTKIYRFNPSWPAIQEGGYRGVGTRKCLKFNNYLYTYDMYI